MFYWLGLVLVLASWLGGAVLLGKWRNKDFTTISKHAASSYGAHVFFASVLIVCGALFYVWLLTYLAPNVLYSAVFTALLSLSVLLQFATAIFPDKPGWKRTVHEYAAWGMALSWLPMAALLVGSGSLSDTARAIAAFCGSYMVITLVVVAGFRKGKFLTYQALYVVAFQLALLAAVYL
ncbi:hypothetical protein EYC59_02805 [Candidatus Saccharibacteria bacterium]|nr:MAG: hypothetical protein EYC59_02805 [Candidatus Saccharibacteria bacterium]